MPEKFPAPERLKLTFPVVELIVKLTVLLMKYVIVSLSKSAAVTMKLS